MQTRQMPLPILPNKDQCCTHLHVHGIPLKSGLLGETANQDGGLVVPTHLDFV